MNNKVLTIGNIAKISILAALSFILMLFSFPLPFAPHFMKIDLGDIPALIATFSMGPLYASLVVILKIIIKVIIKGSQTFYVGDLSNIIVGVAFVAISGIIYKRKKSFKNAIISMVLGVVSMTVFATLSNYFFIIPLYAKILKQLIDNFIRAGAKVNPFVNSYATLIIFAIVPFNLVKGFIEVLVILPLYKKLSPILKK